MGLGGIVTAKKALDGDEVGTTAGADGNDKPLMRFNLEVMAAV